MNSKLVSASKKKVEKMLDKPSDLRSDLQVGIYGTSAADLSVPKLKMPKGGLRSDVAHALVRDDAASTAERKKMKLNSKDFRVRKGDEVNLKKWPTIVKPVYKSKEQYQKLLEEHVAQLSSQQQLLYASNRHAVLLIFQAMDAAGKDGAIRHVMSGVNPQGCQVFSFKHPSATELEHDFLWRTTRDLPERGRIGIFNRSYYEEVLIVRVHPEILRSEGDPGRAASRQEDMAWPVSFDREFGETSS